MSRDGFVTQNINLIKYGKNYLPYDVWKSQVNPVFFYDFVEKGIRPLLDMFNYFISMNTEELGDRISYWAWEVYVYEKSAKQKKITSLVNQSSMKTREQYINYQLSITDTEWNDLFDDWEMDFLFLRTRPEGMNHRYNLPDFLWKLISDDNWVDNYDSDDEPVTEKRRETSVTELGWMTNNRRNC